jgi:hypothetical protein
MIYSNNTCLSGRCFTITLAIASLLGIASTGSVADATTNPYVVDESTLVVKPFMMTALLTASEDKLRSFTKYGEDFKAAGKTPDPMNLDPRLIPTGKNNQIIDTVKMEVG